MNKETLQYKEITEENGNKTILKSKRLKRHSIFAKEMNTSSKYLTHQVIPNIGETGVHLAEDFAAFLEEYNSVNTV